MSEDNLETENQLYPVCPWCGEDIDPVEMELDFSDLIREDKHPTINMRCPMCDQEIEISASFVYSTYKGDENTDSEMNAELYGESEEYFQ